MDSRAGEVLAVRIVVEVSGTGKELIMQVLAQLPAQTPTLPYEIEKLTIAAGREFMKQYYRLAIERADLELVLNHREGRDGAGIQRYGKRAYTFKTSFGVVRVKRIRIRHKSDGSTEIPSAKAWATPRQAMITAGLKAAVCNLVVKQSFSSTVRQLEEQTGQAKILSKSTIGNILHSEGERLSEANLKRAAAVFEQDSKAKGLLGRAEAFLGEEFFAEVYLPGRELTDDLSEEELQELIEEIQWDPRTTIEPADDLADDSTIESTNELTNELTNEVSNDESNKPANEITEPRVNERVNEVEGVGVRPAVTSTAFLPSASASASPLALASPLASPMQIVVQPDEVVVASQEAGKQWLINYSAVVSQGERSWYVSAGSSQQLFYQVGGLLASLGLNNPDQQLLMISDGAGWIRRWYESIGIKNKESVLCWYHLEKKCWRLLREGIENKTARLAVKKELFSYLWRGKVEEARQYLSKLIEEYEDGCSSIEITNIKSLVSLKEYLLLRQEHIPNYLHRLKTKQWIASTRIEKFHDWSVSSRCKKQNGMRWKQKGVGAIAGLEVVRRNGEMAEWREQAALPNWAQWAQAA